MKHVICLICGIISISSFLTGVMSTEPIFETCIVVALVFLTIGYPFAYLIDKENDDNIGNK